MSTTREAGVSSPHALRRANQAALLQFALRTLEFTAADAIAASGLSRATVLSVCADLKRAGWLHHVDDPRVGTRSGPGRPPLRYSLDAGAGFVMGVDAGQHTFLAQVADLRGRVLAQHRRESMQLKAADRLEAMREMERSVLAAANVSSSSLLLTVIGVPAPVNEYGRSPGVDGHWGSYWSTMNPGFENALGGKVMVENDANLAAFAQHSISGNDNLATLLMGERFGAGLIIDGHFLRGAAGGAGEMRFLNLLFDEPRGADGVAALARRWAREALLNNQKPSALEAIPLDEIRAEDVFEAASRADPLGEEILKRIGERIAEISAVLSSLLGVEQVMIAGAAAHSMGPVINHARSVLPGMMTPPRPALAASTLGPDVVVRGAIEHGLSQLRADPLRHLHVPGVK